MDGRILILKQRPPDLRANLMKIKKRKQPVYGKQGKESTVLR